jgi:hypothetical protein
MRALWIMMVGCMLVLCASAQATTISIDFESADGMTTAIGYKTKSHSLSVAADPRPGSSGSNSVEFSFVSDGSSTQQWAWLIVDLDQAYDFSAATMTFWGEKINRSLYTGLELFAGGLSVAKWDYRALGGIYEWTQYQIVVGTDDPDETGTGDIHAVDQIRFIHRMWDSEGSGKTHAMRFDDFLATGVIPEPATMGLLAVGGALTLLRRKR